MSRASGRTWLNRPGWRHPAGLALHVVEGKRAHASPNRHQADDHAEVADAVDDERLVGRVARRCAARCRNRSAGRSRCRPVPRRRRPSPRCRRSTSPNMLKQKSERYWKKRWKRPRRRSGWPSASGASAIGHVVQLLVHVAKRVDVDARGDQRHHAEHGHRQRVDVVADRSAIASRTGPACTNRRRRDCGDRRRGRKRIGA